MATSEMNLLTTSRLKPLRRVLALLFVVVFTSGASNQATVLFTSNSPGGVLVQKGQSYGGLPVTLTFNIPYTDQQKGGAWIAGGYVDWPNGTRTNFDKFHLDLTQNNSFTYTINQGSDGRKQQALDDCYRDLRDIQSFCSRDSNYPCWGAISAARETCYNDALKDMRCDISRVHADIICPIADAIGGSGAEFYSCVNANSEIAQCQRDEIRRRRRLNQQLQ
jgi:hypothetical protein